MDANMDDFQPSTLYEALSRKLTVSFPQQPYREGLGKHTKGISKFEYKSGYRNETKLHCIATLPNLPKELDEYAQEYTKKLTLDQLDGHYSDFLRVVDQQKTLNFKNESPRAYAEDDTRSLVKSLLLDPAIYALRILEGIGYIKDGKANLNLAFGSPADYSFWFAAFPKLSNITAIADGALYKRAYMKQFFSPKNNHSNSYLSILLKKYGPEDQEGDKYIPLSRGDEEAICCPLEVKSQSLIEKIMLDELINMFVTNEKNSVAMPFLYPTKEDHLGPASQCRVIVQVSDSGINLQ